MYGSIAGGAAAGGAAGAGAGALAATGSHTLALIVGACTLVAAGLSVMKLAPRRNR